MRIVYFAPVLDDPALARRVRTLLLGGADVELVGFRRTAHRVDAVEGIVPSGDLGQTFHQRLGSRAVAVLSRSLRAREWAPLVKRADLLLARNLEMATIADAARASVRNPPLVYEVLDIHGILCGRRLGSKALRYWERRIVSRSVAVIVSSPAFVTHHFRTLGSDLPPVMLIENKRIAASSDTRDVGAARVAGPPWRIGWYGLLRCTRSADILYELARLCPQSVEIEIRGIPADNVRGLLSLRPPLPNMRYLGPYDQTEVPAIYSGVHFTWAIDYYQAGQNSDWLLPNRLYEGLLFGTPVLARAETETARWLRERRVGIVISDPGTELREILINMTAAQYRHLQERTKAIPRDDLVHTNEECRSIVERLAALAPPP